MLELHSESPCLLRRLRPLFAISKETELMLLGTQRVNAQGHLEIGGCDAVELAREQDRKSVV